MSLLALSRFDKTDQILRIVKPVVIARDSVAMIYDAAFFVLFQTFQQFAYSETPCKKREYEIFGFRQKSLSAFFFAFVTMRDLLFLRAVSVFALIFIRAFRRAALANFVFCAKATGKPAPRNAQCFFYASLPKKKQTFKSLLF